MPIRVRLTEDVAGWRAGSTLGFADDRAAEDILGKGTFVVYDPAPTQPSTLNLVGEQGPEVVTLPSGMTASDTATEHATAEIAPEAETPAETFVGDPAETETA